MASRHLHQKHFRGGVIAKFYLRLFMNVFTPHEAERRKGMIESTLDLVTLSLHNPTIFGYTVTIKQTKGIPNEGEPCDRSLLQELLLAGVFPVGEFFVESSLIVMFLNLTGAPCPAKQI